MLCVYKFKYIQIGTDCVFSGNTGNYVESSFQDAEDVYGKSKIGGEVVHNYKKVVRASIVGPEVGEGKSLLYWFLSQEKNEINEENVINQFVKNLKSKSSFKLSDSSSL